MNPASKITPISGPWGLLLEKLIGAATYKVWLTSPFVTHWAAKLVTDSLRTDPRQPQLTLLTDLSPHVVLRSSEPEAFHHFMKKVDVLQVRHLDNVHAKVYVADHSGAVITSGNLTRGGIQRNHEVGVLLQDDASVRSIHQVMQKLISKSVVVSREALLSYLDLVVAAKDTEEYDPAIPTSLKKGFQRMVKTESSTASLRMAFLPTIINAVETQGPLTVRELYEAVRENHTSLCDDRVTRGNPPRPVWRHEVRFALQVGKERGLFRRVIRQGSRTGIWERKADLPRLAERDSGSRRRGV